MTIEADARRAAAAVSEARLWARLMTMASFGARADGGVDRQALSAEDIAARAELLAWAEARGYRALVDPAANLFLRRHGRDPNADPIVAGSHLDSQPAGGRFDGVYGVLAALEALEALDDAGIETDRPVEVVAWTNEEGCRFAPGAMGSALFTGECQLTDCLEIQDRAGIRLGDALSATLAATPDLERRRFEFPIAAYLEPHIEQGPRLEAAGVPVGVVTSIQGARWYEVEVVGEPAHAGTAPLRGRRDALLAAIEAIRALQSLMADPDDVVRFTVGRLVVEPNSPNTVPARVAFSIDFRHPDQAVLDRLGAQIATTAEAAAAPCALSIRETFYREPVVFPDLITGAIARAARALDLPCLDLASGAFHDANFLADVCPTGMIFVPCAQGISHSPKEAAEPADLAAGARVLAATIVELAGLD